MAYCHLLLINVVNYQTSGILILSTQGMPAMSKYLSHVTEKWKCDKSPVWPQFVFGQSDVR